MDKRRLIASAFAILLALAMLFAYVIEVREFAKPAPQPDETDSGQLMELLTGKMTPPPDAENNSAPDSVEEAGSIPDTAEEDAANAAAATGLAATDPEAAADTLARIEDQTVYESTLRTILNGRYESGASNEDLVPFTSHLDARGTPIADRYANAYDERSAGADNGYIPAQLLLVADGSGETDTERFREAVPQTMGTVAEVIPTDGLLIAVVDLTLEWSVQDAAATFADSDLHAQPDYIYYPLENDAPAEDTADGKGSAGEINDTEETGTADGKDDAEETGLSDDKDDAGEAEADDESDPAGEDPAALETPDGEASSDERADLVSAPAVTIEILSDLNALFSSSPASLPLTACWDMLPADHKTVRVGVLDTGVVSAHEDLDEVLAADPSTGALLSGDYSNGRIVPGSVSEKDRNHHGTHVCGIIAAEANGTGTAGVAAGYSMSRNPDTAKSTVTPVTELVVANAYVYFQQTGSWGFSSTSLAKGLDYLTGQDCRIINMSLSGTIPYDDMPVMDAIEHAVSRDILLIIAAGNRDTSNHAEPPYISYPGWYPCTISVVNAQTADTRYASSNYGPDCDIAAPGTKIYSTATDTTGTDTTSYSTKTGTSMSAPVITGIAAMMLYMDPSLSSREIRNILYATAGNQLAPEEQPAAGEVNANSAFQGSPENEGNELGFGYTDPVAALTAVQERLAGAQNYADYLELNRTTITGLGVGERTTLEYRLLPAAAAIPAAGRSIIWESSDPSVATVDADGIVTSAGNGTCTITGTYPGAGADGADLQAAVTVSITAVLLDKNSASVEDIPDAVYTGSQIKPTPAVTLQDGTVLDPESDYTLKYSSNTNAGTATVTVQGKGQYYGTLKKTFKILPKEIKSSDLSLTKTSYVYEGNAVIPSFTVKSGGITLRSGTDYTTQYTDTDRIGTATITVTGKGNYKGTATKTFTITSPCSIKNLWASKHEVGYVTFKWTKLPGTAPSGWQVKYRTKKIGNGSWSDWRVLDFDAGTYDYRCPVKADYVVEFHAKAKQDASYSRGVITTPAGGKYQAMKTVYVKNTATGKRIDSLTLRVGQTVYLRPDYEYPVADYKARPRLYPTHALWDLTADGRTRLTITKPDGSAYSGGIIDGAATIRAVKAGTTTLICRAPNGRTKVLTVVIQP